MACPSNGERLFWQVLVIFFGSRCAMANVGTGDVTQVRDTEKNQTSRKMWGYLPRGKMKKHVSILRTYNYASFTCLDMHMPHMHLHWWYVSLGWWNRTLEKKFLAGTDAHEVRPPLTPTWDGGRIDLSTNMYGLGPFVSRFEFIVYSIMGLDQRCFKWRCASFKKIVKCHKMPWDSDAKELIKWRRPMMAALGHGQRAAVFFDLPSCGKDLHCMDLLSWRCWETRVSQGHMQAKQVTLVKRCAKWLLHFWSIARRSSVLQA